jgi:hypothetical protein
MIGERGFVVRDYPLRTILRSEYLKLIFRRESCEERASG